MQFEYPWNGDKKKLKFIIKGLELARYLVTVLGSNIKTVTWMGDNINYNTVFQGGSSSYLDEDINEIDGDYDVANSAVTIIDKLGPLNSDAPYVIEFKKEPQASDWANFMISCQGIGDDVQMSALEGAVTAETGTVIDSSDANAYSTTTSMEPELNNNSFTPVTPPTNTLVSATYSGPATTTVDTDCAVRTMVSGNRTDYLRVAVKASVLPAGYYLLTFTNNSYSAQTMSYSIVANNIGSAMTDHKTKTVQTFEEPIGSNYLKNISFAMAMYLSTDAAPDQGLFTVDLTSGSNIYATGWSAMIAPISAAYYNSL